MNTTTALQLCLVLHVTGLVMMAGMSIADMLAYSNFWKLYAADKQRGIALLSTGVNFQKFLGIGAGLLLITGVCMMAITHGVFGGQLWMKIKIGIVVLIIINGPVLGRMQVMKLKRLVMDGNQSGDKQQQIAGVKRIVNLMSVANLIFLATIVILSIFKFN